MSFIDSISDYVLYPFEKVRRQIPERQKHFNTAIFVAIALMLAEIPLVGGIRVDEQTQATFRVSGTLMQLGTQPFVFASMLTPFLFKKDEKNADNVLGLLFSIVMAGQWAYNNGSWFGGIELCAVGWALLQAETYLSTRGSVSPSTALIFANGSRRILSSVYGHPLSFAWTAVLFVVVAWIETLVVTLPLTHIQYRSQTTSMPIPVMYNSTTALVMYYTLVETLANIYPPANVLIAKSPAGMLIAAPCFYLGTWFINKRLPSFNNRTAKDLVTGWKEQKYALKGWRDPARMYKFVQNIMDRNIRWNTVFLCLLWTCTLLCPPTVSVTTLFIMTSTIMRQKVRLV
jgi:preprotein translocase subunit SecY